MKENEIAQLVQFGLTKLESEIYLALLEIPNATGYRLAQYLSKPVPNTYKALNSLKTKNLVLSDDSQKTQIYTAMPISEYLDLKSIEFNTKRKALEQQLVHYETPQAEGGIYRLDNIQDMLSRAKVLIQNTTDILLVDIFPGVFPLLQNQLEKCGKAGIKVLVKTYEPVEMNHCSVIYNEIDGQFPQKFFGEWLNIIVDGREHLLSFFSLDENKIYEGFWSNNLFLSLMMHNGFSSEFTSTLFANLIEANASSKEMQETLKLYESMKTSKTQAFKDFLNQYSQKN